MRILAFDCAGAQCAAAILIDDRIAASKRIAADRGHAQFLVPLLNELIRIAGLAYRDIDRFAVTTGPGSFTGIRVALATAQGLALGTGKPIIGVTTFEALAAAAAEAGVFAPRLLVAIDSRRAEIFVQLFDGAGLALGEPAMLPPNAIAAWAGSGPLALAGDAAGLVAPHLPMAVKNPARSWLTAIDPTIVARLAVLRASGTPPAPFYLRPPDAVPARVR
jgi:tRNA threonylcarbamoyladenosine biosynthesis protein TsaB